MKNDEAKKASIVAMHGVLAILMLFSLTLGRYEISAKDAVIALSDAIFGRMDGIASRIVVGIRLPRILLCCLVGSSLAASGTTYQAMFQNPMASPDILGATNGAAFGAAIAILLGGNRFCVAATAFAMSFAAVSAVCFIANRATGRRVANLILAGMMIGAIFSSLISLVKLVADPASRLPEITYWLMGSLSGASFRQFAWAIFPISAGLLTMFSLRWQLNLLAFGDEEAMSMGANVKFLRAALITAATLATAVSVSIAGAVGFVGLVVPHFCRKIVGNNHLHLMSASMVCGAIFLLVVDDFARTLASTEIPLGILTSFIGAPFFLYLIYRKETQNRSM